MQYVCLVPYTVYRLTYSTHTTLASNENAEAADAQEGASEICKNSPKVPERSIKSQGGLSNDCEWFGNVPVFAREFPWGSD